VAKAAGEKTLATECCHLPSSTNASNASADAQADRKAATAAQCRKE